MGSLSESWAGEKAHRLYHKDENCRLLIHCRYQDLIAGHPVSVAFRLPVIMKTGCVERATRSAGGLLLKCYDGPHDYMALPATALSSSKGDYAGG